MQGVSVQTLVYTIHSLCQLADWTALNRLHSRYTESQPWLQ